MTQLNPTYLDLPRETQPVSARTPSLHRPARRPCMCCSSPLACWCAS